MTYFDDLDFVNIGYSESANNSTHNRLFNGYYGIQFLYQGKMYAYTGDHQIEYGDAPAIFITAPGIPFNYGSPPGMTRSQAHVCFCGKRVERYLESQLLILRETNLFRKVSNPETFLDTFKQLQHLLQIPGSYHHSKAVLCLENLLLMIQEQSAIHNKSLSRYAHTIRNLQKHIATEPLVQWDYHTEAQKMGLSYAHFRKNFKQVTSCSPAAFLQECRLQYAKNILINTNKRIKEIAEECGFCDMYQFSKIFKKHHNLSPQEFRKIYKS